MRQVLLGKSGLKVSAVGFGGIPIQRLSFDEAERVIRRALELGVTFIDTAAAYGDSQRKIGRAIAGRREGLVLASKAYCTSKEELLCEVERSRRELDADVIDLYQLHSVSEPDQWERIRGPGGALAGVLEAREKGHVAHVGFTSHSLDLALELVEESAFETVQFPFNLVTSEPAEELIPRARELGLGFIVMKPLCGGQYDNAGFAFKYLNGFPDIVPI
ncbi:MAG: aldo/keto reductase, partial [Planctomycetota bacterium]